MKKRIIIISLIILVSDFIIVKILKNLEIWHLIEEKKSYWRIGSNIYHHDILPNINVEESWGKYKYKLITNSLGFRDFNQNIVKKQSDKKRIALIGDSFIEGIGLSYEDSLSGKISNFLIDDYEVLNMGVASYSPTNYYYKLKHFLEKEYIFDSVFVFLDLSDIIDEIKYEYDKNNQLVLNFDNFKSKKILFSKFLDDNFIVFKFVFKFSEFFGKLKKKIKNRYIEDGIGASRVFEKKFFSVTTQDRNLYYMIYKQPSIWTFNNKNLRYNFENTKKGLEKSEMNLKRLFKLLNENNIKSKLIIYPHPAQIYLEDTFYQDYWYKFSKKNNIEFVNIFPAFEKKNLNKKKFILENFIVGDIHWNEKGSEIAFDFLKKNKHLN
tara:strand:- start:539 stop:1678 length:1140 start_codon:yes stop_codon:yes gene_type:complete